MTKAELSVELVESMEAERAASARLATARKAHSQLLAMVQGLADEMAPVAHARPLAERLEKYRNGAIDVDRIIAVCAEVAAAEDALRAAGESRAAMERALKLRDN